MFATSSMLIISAMIDVKNGACQARGNCPQNKAAGFLIHGRRVSVVACFVLDIRESQRYSEMLLRFSELAGWDRSASPAMMMRRHGNGIPWEFPFEADADFPSDRILAVFWLVVLTLFFSDSMVSIILGLEVEFFGEVQKSAQELCKFCLTRKRQLRPFWPKGCRARTDQIDGPWRSRASIAGFQRFL